MPNFLENLGLDNFMESEDAIRGLMGYIASKGETFEGYTKDLTIFLPSGSIDFFVRVKHDDKQNQYLIEGLDTHICGMEMWKIRISNDITPADADPLSKRVLITNNETGSGLAVVNVLNSHMLPSLMENDVYDFQVCAFPVEIDYFENEDVYTESIPKTITGQTYGLAKGTIFPSGFFHNHDPRNNGEDVDYSSDDLVLIMGEVKRAYWGTFELEDEKYSPFVICEIDTQFGLLRIAHTVEQVNEAQRSFMKPGCIVSGIFALSADAAVGEYEKDAALVLNEEKSLKALRYEMCKGETERLRSVLSEDIIYDSKTTDTIYSGIEEVIERLNYVHEESGKSYEARMAYISAVAEDMIDPDCEPGKRCFLLKDKNAEDYESIVFISTDDEGKIVRITTTDSPDYTFTVDQYPHPEELSENSEIPTDYREAMLMRARVFGWIDREWEIESMCFSTDFFDTMLEKAEKRIRNIPLKDVEEKQDYLRNMFGYFFALGFQYMLYDEVSGDFDGIENDNPIINCDTEDKSVFREIYEFGKSFFIDYKIRVGVDVNNKESIQSILTALQFLCHFGFYCASEKLIDTLRENTFSKTDLSDYESEVEKADEQGEQLQEVTAEEKDIEIIRNKTHLDYLKTLCECYSTGDFEPLFFFLSDDVVMESQWVLTPNVGREAVEDYFTGKGKTLKEHKCFPECKIVRLIGNMNAIDSNVSVNGEEPHNAKVGLWYPDGKLCMYMSQTLNCETNGVIVDVTMDDRNMISRIDLCMPGLFSFEPYEDDES